MKKVSQWLVMDYMTKQKIGALQIALHIFTQQMLGNAFFHFWSRLTSLEKIPSGWRERERARPQKDEKQFIQETVKQTPKSNDGQHGWRKQHSCSGFRILETEWSFLHCLVLATDKNEVHHVTCYVEKTFFVSSQASDRSDLFKIFKHAKNDNLDWWVYDMLIKILPILR